MLFVRDTPNNCFDLASELPGRSDPSMTEYRLIALFIVRMRSHENGRVLPSLSDAVYELVKGSVVLCQAIGDERIVDVLRIELLNDLTIDRQLRLRRFRGQLVN